MCNGRLRLYKYPKNEENREQIVRIIVVKIIAEQEGITLKRFKLNLKVYFVLLFSMITIFACMTCLVLNVNASMAFHEVNEKPAIFPTRTNATFPVKNAENASQDLTGFSDDRVIVRVSESVILPQSTDYFLGIEIESNDVLMTLNAPTDRGARSMSTPDSLRVITLKNKGKESVMAAIAKLNQTPGIVYAEPDYMVHSLEIIPNDLNFNTPSMWGMRKIRATDAWQIATGSNDVVVAVIDTGIDYRHPDLAANMWRNPGETENDGIDNDGNGFVDDIYGWCYLWEDESHNRVSDSNGHGTHVAGIIGATGNNNIGISGVNWNVKLMSLKALSNFGEGSISDIIHAIHYADLMQAPIINCSYGNSEYSQAEKDAINSCDALFVVAAGNDAANNDEIRTYPSNYDCPNILSVAATTFDDSLTDFSNYGANSVHIAAPGDSIFSTMPVGSYGILSGTSMATPYVTGAAALVLANNPGMTTTEIKTRLLKTVDPVPELAGMISSGGRLNAYRALNPSAPIVPPYIPVFPSIPKLPVEFAGGNGSLADPYKVSTPYQLNAVRYNPDKFFIQINDIDMTYDTQDPNGAFYNETQGWEPIESISGIYNGNGYSIIGLKISRPDIAGCGLISINNGFIMNLGLENCNILGMQTGSLVGINTNVIANCYNSGSVTAFGGYIGGLAGFNEGEIINSYNAGDVSEVGDYVAIVGGITSAGGKVIDCYNTGNISAPYAPDNRLGGIGSYGFKGDHVKNCYNSGITKNLNGSGFGAVMARDNGAAIENSYCLGLYEGGGGTVLTEVQMKQRISFTDWDFTAVWEFREEENSGYPMLQARNIDIPIPAQNEIIITDSTFSYENDTQSFTGNVLFHVASKENRELYVILAIYDDVEKLAYVQPYHRKMFLGNYSGGFYDISFPADAAKEYRMKLFLWTYDYMNNPVATPASLDISY